MRAIIKKYQNRYSAVLVRKDTRHNAPIKNNYCSNLTEFLLKNFGWQFVFFAAKGKVQPYGYSIIDHKNKQVYKGGDIITLQELTQNKAQLNNQIAFSARISVNDVIQQSSISFAEENTHRSIITGNMEISIPVNTHDDPILNSLIDDQLYRLDAEAKEDGRQKKKRKRKI